MTIGIYLEIIWMLIWLFDLQYFGFGNVFGTSFFKIRIKKAGNQTSFITKKPILKGSNNVKLI